MVEIFKGPPSGNGVLKVNRLPRQARQEGVSAVELEVEEPAEVYPPAPFGHEVIRVGRLPASYSGVVGITTLPERMKDYERYGYDERDLAGLNLRRKLAKQ